MSVYAGPNTVKDNLVTHFDFLNTKCYNGSNTLFDLSASKNNGTIFGSPIFNNKSLFFDGVNDYINIEQPNVGLSPNRWTVCLLMNPGNQQSRFITPNSAGIDQFLEYDLTNQRIRVNIVESADTNGRARSSPNNSILVNNWYYICVSIDNLNIKIYINGLLVSESNETISIANWSADWRIGQRGNSTFWYLGSMSVIQIYNSILTNSEIKQNFYALRGRFNI